MNKITGVTDGLLYDANNDERVLVLRRKAKTLCAQFNATTPDDEKARLALISSILGGHGKNPVIEAPFHCDYGTHITVGDNFFANHGLVILDGAKVTIGDNVFLAPGVGIHTAGHPIDSQRRNQGLEYALPVEIGNNVWIGASVVILPGVTIGENTVIGAGSVVTSNIPANVVAVGSPCRVVRSISDSDAEKTDFRRGQ